MMLRCAPPNSATEEAGWPRWSLYGLTLASDFSFANRLIASGGTPDLYFSCAASPPAGVRLDGWTPVYTHPYRFEDGQSFMLIYRTGDCHVVRYSGVADFYLSHDRVTCHLLDPTYWYAVEIRLLGDVMSLWLEMQGVLALHASAVIVDDQAVAFASWNKGGKTSLAASLMQAGSPMLTDDVLAVRLADQQIIAAAGYPQMRMWPQEAEHFVGPVENLEIVHPMYSKRRIPVGSGGLGRFHTDPAPLRCLYILERVADGENEEIVQLEPREAMLQLLRHSFARELVEALKLQPQRLPRLAHLIGAIPVRAVRHSVPLESLADLGAAVLRDLDGPHD